MELSGCYGLCESPIVQGLADSSCHGSGGESVSLAGEDRVIYGRHTAAAGTCGWRPGIVRPVVEEVALRHTGGRLCKGIGPCRQGLVLDVWFSLSLRHHV